MKELMKHFRDREFPERSEVVQVLFPFIQELAEEKKILQTSSSLKISGCAVVTLLVLAQ